MRIGERRSHQNGFAYLYTLLFTALVGVAGLRALENGATEIRRAREAQLLEIGERIRHAIGSYYESSPGAVKQYPATLDELLWDKRHIVPKRHIRRIEKDPMTRSDGWGLIPGVGGGVSGVYSTSQRLPLKQAGFPSALADFKASAAYSDWQFIYLPVSGLGAVAF